MLIRFGAANYLSIREFQEISLIAAPLKDVEIGLIRSVAVPKERILPAAIIYGPNASGKSNVLAAFDFMRSAVLFSHRKGTPDGGVPRTPFALDHGCAGAPSEFSVDFSLDEVRHHYGFEANDESFTHEWLYAFPKNRKQLLFERDNRNFEFGRNLRGRNKIISDLTRSNSLFVSAAAQNGHEQLLSISKFFESIFNDSDFSVEEDQAYHRLREDKLDSRVIKFLKNLDTGVVDYRRLEKELDDKDISFRKGIAELMRSHVAEEIDLSGFLEQTKQFSIELAHRGKDGKDIYFKLRNESAGTRRLLILLSRVFNALDSGTVLFIDELDASLHTKACEAIIELFCSSELNPNGAQIIATTHDTNLLLCPFLRRDQIWFTEKDGAGATQLYPLSDYRSRRGDNFEKGYLEGRYGAMPITSPIFEIN